jgi:hypothetical protein
MYNKTKLKIMSNSKKLSPSNFDFTFQGYGRYEVTYTTPSGRVYGCTTTDMQLIDATRGEDCPKQSDLKTLARMCRRANFSN